MKKSIILTFFVLLSFSLSAQHVTPLKVELTSFNLDTLRQQFQGSAYLLELKRLDNLMKDDTRELKDAHLEIQEERKHQKQMVAYITKAEKTFKNLQSLTQKELDALKSLKIQAEKELHALNSTTQLNADTRTKANKMLQDNRVVLERSINSTIDRQMRLANHISKLQDMRTDLMVYNNELTNKDTDIKQLESTLQSRRAVIQTEIKNVKAQK